MTTTNNEGFKLTTTAQGFASFCDGKTELTRYRPGMQWELYAVTQSGPSRGLPMFARYLTESEAARLDSAVSEELARIQARTILATHFLSC